MKRDKTRRMEFDQLRVANPIELENLNRSVTRPDIYPLVPATHSVPWNTYVRSQKVSPRTRSNSSSTEALDSNQARQTTRRILQHTRSLPTRSPEPQIQIVGRKSTSDSDLSKRYTTRTPRVSGRDRSSYRSDYMTEYEDYAAVGNRTPATPSMIQRPKTKLVKPKESRESERSYPIIGESASMFTDMMDTMLKVLDRRAAIAAQARELENTLAENAYALGQCRQRLTGYVPGSVARHSLSSQPFYMNTVPRTNSVGVPLTEYTPVPQMGSMLYASTPTSHVQDILPPLAPEQDRVEYVEEQRRYKRSVRPTSSNDRSGVSSNLSREIQEFCSHWDDYRPDERETHHVRLESMKEQKAKQRQQRKKEQDEVYQQMTRNLEKARAEARESLSRASTISVEKYQTTLTRTDFRCIKEKMNKIDQKLDSLYENWQAEYKEAVTLEQCEEIQKFYEPHVQKYERKYKWLRGTLKQAIGERKRISSPRVTTTRDFFNNVTERRSATEVPATTVTDVPQPDTPLTTSASEIEHSEPSPVRTFPPSETPSRPIVTATLRPRVLEQSKTEGQVEDQSQKDDGSKNETIKPLVMEGQLDELGPERRIVHPFNIPGVRNPTEDTPPTQRGLVENDTQTDEYLEDAPSWEQGKCYPSRYGDPLDRDHGIDRERGWLLEDITERGIDKGQGRFSSHGHGRNDHDRNDFPPSVGRDIRLKLPPGQARFTDWSSISTPPAVFSLGLPEKSTELDENIPNQVNGPAAEITRSEGIDVSNVDKATMAFQSEFVREDPDMCAGPTIPIDTGPQNNNLEQNEENVDIIPPVPISKARLSLHTDEAVIVDTSQEASVGNDVPGSNKVRSQTMAGVSSIRPVDSHIMSGERQMVVVNRGRDPPRTSIMNKRNSSDGSDDERSRRDRGRPPERGYPDRGGPFDRGRPPDRRGYPDRGGPFDRGRPPDRSGYLDRGGPFDRGRPPDRRRSPDRGGPFDKGKTP